MPIDLGGHAPKGTGHNASRLFVILARDTPFAAVLRRGPSKLVRLIGWHTDTDEFQNGQWFRGRIYERRCDLSPDGKYLVYFAASFRGPLYSWTAVSRPPYLTAIALWPKGDCWAGGGQFEEAGTLWLNHEADRELADGFSVPDDIALWPAGYGGEDGPIHSLRLMRDGWHLVQLPAYIDLSERDRRRIGVSFLFHPPEIWERECPDPKIRARLRMVEYGLGESDGPWNVVAHEIRLADETILSLGRSDWADWDRNGDLLYAKDGKLFRLSPGPAGNFDIAEARELADFNGQKFEPVPPPDWAKQW